MSVEERLARVEERLASIEDRLNHLTEKVDKLLLNQSRTIRRIVYALLAFLAASLGVKVAF